jgi:hypothetical protein
MPYLGFGSISGVIHILAKLRYGMKWRVRS